MGDYSLLVCLALARGAGNRSILCNSSDSRSFLLGLSLLMLISLSCKRAQFPFIAWLPAAIAAPTPVSALVHSSTLVAAGVYLGIRRFRVMTPLVLLMLGALSSWRRALSSLRALFCIDGKKVIALSTLSQISIVGIVLSLGLPSLALFHLLTHAFVKSYLFLSLGLVLHSSHGAQDFRSLGVGRSPVRTLHLVVALIALSAMPFLTIFFSKEVLILTSLQSGFCLLATVILLLGSCVTLLYSFRLVSSLFLAPTSLRVLKNKDSLVASILGTGFFSRVFLGRQLGPLTGRFLLSSRRRGPLILMSVLLGLSSL